CARASPSPSSSSSPSPASRLSSWQPWTRRPRCRRCARFAPLASPATWCCGPPPFASGTPQSRVSFLGARPPGRQLPPPLLLPLPPLGREATFDGGVVVLLPVAETPLPPVAAHCAEGERDRERVCVCEVEREREWQPERQTEGEGVCECLCPSGVGRRTNS
ncbi:hypothetical protein DFJ73DRAFT_923282, partial [Zopfochytrium polystomum]